MFDNNGKTIISYDSESILQRLKILLFTEKGELLGDCDYGSNLMQQIFQWGNLRAFDLIEEAIVGAVSTYEPHVILVNSVGEENKIDIVFDEDINTMYINIKIQTAENKDIGFVVPIQLQNM